VIHVYALLPGSAVAPEIAGVDDRPVVLQDAAGLAAAVSTVVAPPEPTPANVLRHGGVVDALAARNPAILPVRFSPPFPDEDAMAAALTERADALRATLDEVAGCVELGVTVAGELEQPTGRAGSGADYLRTRLAARVERNRLAEVLDAPLRQRALARSPRARRSTGLVLDCSYLVRADEVEGFRQAVAELGRDLDRGLAIACTGPWAPYSFASGIPTA